MIAGWKVICIIFVSSFLKYCNAVLDVKLILNFFEHKYCSVGIVFGCSGRLEQTHIMRDLQEDGLRVAYFDLSKNSDYQSILRKAHDRMAIVLDSDCNNTESLLNTSADSGFFFDTYYWLVFDPNQDATEKFRNIKLYINTEITLAVPENIDPSENKVLNWTLIDIYNPAFARNGQLRLKVTGYFNYKDGYKTSLRRSKYYSRRNMSDTTLKSVMVIPENISIPLDEYMANDEDRHNNTYSRFQARVIENCRDMFNFSLDYIIANSWGYLQPDGNVDGMAKALQDKLADFGSAPLMFKLYRLKVLDYGYGTFFMRSMFFFRHPRTTASSSELYLRPLVDSVWFSIVAALLVIALILKVIIGKELRVLESHMSADDVSWSFLFLYSVGEICQQGFSYMPSLPSGRIVIMTVLIFSFLIYQFYSASVVSILLMEPPRTINTLKDLLESSLEVGCQNSLYDTNYFRQTTNPVAITLYNKKIKREGNSTNFFSAEAGLRKVEKGGFAFHSQVSSAYPIILSKFSEKAICDLTELQMYRSQHLFTTMVKKSPFREMLNYCVAHQIETGVMDRLRKHWTVPKYQCLQPTEYLEITVGLKESYWALLILAFGILVSLILLLGEKIWSKSKSKIKKRQEKPIQFIN